MINNKNTVQTTWEKTKSFSKGLTKIEGILTSPIQTKTDTNEPHNQWATYYLAFFQLEGIEQDSALDIPVIFRLKDNLKPDISSRAKVLLTGQWAEPNNSTRPSFTCSEYQILTNPPPPTIKSLREQISQLLSISLTKKQEWTQRVDYLFQRIDYLKDLQKLTKLGDQYLQAYLLLKSASYALENETKLYQQEMIDYIHEKSGVRLSQPSISVLLKKLGITRKKLTYHYTQLDEEKAKAFNEEIKLLLPQFPFLALDECSFYPKLDPRFGYSLKGTRAVAKKPSHKGEHYTLLFVISNLKENGVIHWKLTKESVNWEIFYNFLEEINPIGNKKNYLIMDNSSVHKAPDKRMEAKLPSVEKQMARKNIKVKFITTYAPMLNPTELVFNLFRQQTEKQRPRNFKEMEKAIEKVVKLLNTKDLSKFFWHCANYFDRKDKKKKLKITDI